MAKRGSSPGLFRPISSSFPPLLSLPPLSSTTRVNGSDGPNFESLPKASRGKSAKLLEIQAANVGENKATSAYEAEKLFNFIILNFSDCKSFVSDCDCVL